MDTVPIEPDRARLRARGLFGSLLPQTIPEVGIEAYLAPTTGTLLFVLAVIVVGLAPLLNARRLRRMDIPATLRVVE